MSTPQLEEQYIFEPMVYFDTKSKNLKQTFVVFLWLIKVSIMNASYIKSNIRYVHYAHFN